MGNLADAAARGTTSDEAEAVLRVPATAALSCYGFASRAPAVGAPPTSTDSAKLTGQGEMNYAGSMPVSMKKWP